MYRLFCLIVFMAAAFTTTAQLDSNLLRVESHWYGQNFFFGETEISLSDLIDLSEGDTQSNALFRKAANRHDFARFCQIAGSFLILYPIVNEAIGRDANFNLAYIGSGLLAASIPIEISSRREALAGLMRYQQSQKSREVHLDIQPLLLRIALRF